jgi:hypothetical protein
MARGWQPRKGDVSPRKEYVPEADEFETDAADLDDYLHDVGVEKELEKRDGMA